MNNNVEKLCENAKNASRKLAILPREEKDKALLGMAKYLREESSKILEENKKDVENLTKKDEYTNAFKDRLTLTSERIEKMAEGLEDIAKLTDPVGEHLGAKKIKGLEVGRVRVPLGVVGIIYEARPNVTADAAGLALKAGNSIILRGSTEAINSNKAITEALKKGLEKTEINTDCISLIEDESRESVNELLKQDKFVDALIPRGGKGLIEFVLKNSTVPVIETGEGNCHTFIDKDADLDQGAQIAVNAKVQRPGVCNAMETMLVHDDIKESFLQKVIPRLEDEGVELRGCEKTREVCDVKSANEADWEKEYLDMILAIKVVKDVNEAIAHITKYGTSHSEAIITENYTTARTFLNEIDAAAVYVNASTRFTDGGMFGMGAEIGISTQKLHARGPMGIDQLTTTKFTILGSGQVRD